MSDTPIERLPWALNIVLTILLDPFYQGVNRIMRNKTDPVMILTAVLWILTLGLFGVGWIIDIVCVIAFKRIRILA